jgi:hypothetical protein
MLKKIISGGQTGADRAGLEAALILNISTGGFCPKGYMTENGKDISLKKFRLKETDTFKYEERTIKNVLSSDGTVIFCKLDSKKRIIGDGTQLTYAIAVNNNKPVIINPARRKFLNWLDKNKIEILNVAGNRESQNPGIFEKTKSFLVKTLFDNE